MNKILTDNALTLLSDILKEEIKEAFSLRIKVLLDEKAVAIFQKELTHDRDFHDVLFLSSKQDNGEEVDVAIFPSEKEAAETKLQATHKVFLKDQGEEATALAAKKLGDTLRRLYSIEGERHYEAEEAVLLSFAYSLGTETFVDEDLAMTLFENVPEASFEDFKKRRDGHFKGDILPGNMNKAIYYGALYAVSLFLRNAPIEEVVAATKKLGKILSLAHRKEEADRLFLYLEETPSLEGALLFQVCYEHAWHLLRYPGVGDLSRLLAFATSKEEEKLGWEPLQIGPFFAAIAVIGQAALDRKELDLADEAFSYLDGFFVEEDGNVNRPRLRQFLPEIYDPSDMDIIGFIASYFLAKDKIEAAHNASDHWFMVASAISAYNETADDHFTRCYRNYLLYMEKEIPGIFDSYEIKKMEEENRLFQELYCLNTERFHLERYYYFKALAFYLKKTGKPYENYEKEALYALQQGESLYPGDFKALLEKEAELASEESKARLVEFREAIKLLKEGKETGNLDKAVRFGYALREDGYVDNKEFVEGMSLFIRLEAKNVVPKDDLGRFIRVLLSMREGNEDNVDPLLQEFLLLGINDKYLYSGSKKRYQEILDDLNHKKQ